MDLAGRNLSFRERVAACWVGKCLGGAIGMPFEGVPYRPSLTPEQIVVQNVPNDDLEMQLIWLRAMEMFGLELSPSTLGEMWLKYIPAGCDEYCIALRNLRHGIMPPYSGYFDNFFCDGMGAAIRSEIWAALFAGNPESAAHFAACDAMVDHWGDGVYGEIFMAAAESKAFVGVAPSDALRQARQCIPPDCRVRRYLDSVFQTFDQKMLTLEEAVVWCSDHFRQANFTDCAMNLASVATAILWGEGDFQKTVLAAVNCGRDTDCTAASCGALLGIANGLEGFPQEWRGKLDDNLIVSNYIQHIPGLPKTLDELTERTIRLAEQLDGVETPLFAPYSPCPPIPRPPQLPTATWLILELSGGQAEALQRELARTGKCPEKFKSHIREQSDLMFCLDSFAADANSLDLFTFATIDSPPHDTVLSVTADVGFTLWINGERIMNHHSRQQAIPSFHRAEGGAAFRFPVQHGQKMLIHWRLYNCRKGTRCAFMFGSEDNNHLECCRLHIGIE